MSIDEFPFTSRLSPHSWLITGFVTRLIRLVPLVEQELISRPEHLSSPMLFNIYIFIMQDLRVRAGICSHLESPCMTESFDYDGK
jgi:hypothetical protein